MPSTNLSFRAPDDLLKKIQLRDPKGLKNPGGVAKRDVERWYTTLAEQLADTQLSPAEAVLLIRIVGAVSEPSEAFVERLAGYVQNTPQDGFHHVQSSLVRKLANCDMLTRWALVDAVERYEVLIKRQPECTLGMALHLVGLHSYHATSQELTLLEGTPAATSQELEQISGEVS